MPESKLFLGYKLRRLRDDNRLTQSVVAERLGISLSYLSQLENNQRPVTATVLVGLSRAFGVDVAEFAEDDHGRLVADLREALAEPLFGDPGPGLREIKQVATAAPAFAHGFLTLHREHRRVQQRLGSVDDTLSSTESGQDGALLPYEEVRDFFHYRNNYIDELDCAAEALGAELNLPDAETGATLTRHLEQAGGVRVRAAAPDRSAQEMWRFDGKARVLTLNPTLAVPTRNFLLAHQIGLLAFDHLIDEVIAESGLRSANARAICRIGLGNYLAGALLMPYRRFAEAARAERHDLERLQHIFHTSVEQVCHRLSTLQRPGRRGIPFYFVRVDRAGNITKRHSATRFQFARFGGACPLWNVHDAFTTPGKFLVQIAEMPDGARYLCIARSVFKRAGGYLEPDRHYAVGLGCEIAHAPDLVYSAGLDLGDDSAAVPIGVSCRICDRPRCPQRAFPPIDRHIVVDPNRRDAVPYGFA